MYGKLRSEFKVSQECEISLLISSPLDLEPPPSVSCYYSDLTIASNASFIFDMAPMASVSYFWTFPLLS